MAEESDIAASCGQVSQFGLRISKELCSYADAISNVDGRIEDLAKDVELTSGVFQDAVLVFDNPETIDVRNTDAENTAKNLIDGYHGILENIHAVLEEGQPERSAWPFGMHKFEILNAELDLKNGGMQLLLLTIQVASLINAKDNSSSGKDVSIRKMEELMSALEASSRRLEAVRTEAILTGGSSTSKPSAKSSPVIDPNGSTEFTYIDDSPPSPDHPEARASAFLSDSSPAVGFNAGEPILDDTVMRERRIPSISLESCVQHVQSVLHQIEEARNCDSDGDVLSPKEARDLMDAYSCTQAVLEQIMAGSGPSDGRQELFGRESSSGSLDASTGLGSSRPPCQRRLKRWRSRMGGKVGEDRKAASKWATISFLWLRSRIRQPSRFLHLKMKCDQPIEFIDILDRTFSFPWKFCCTWKGMEDLIKQAFASDASVCQRVYKGNYDLVGPDGATILPMLWTTMVRPGWTIKMRMHGMNEHAHISHAPPIVLSDDPWLNFSLNRGRSLKRRGSHSPVIIDVCEGPAGVQVIPQEGLGRRQSMSRKAMSAPGAGLYRTASLARRPATDMAQRGLSPTRALLIDVSPRPRTRGKSRCGNRRSLSPVPPPPPPPPPPPVLIDPDEEPESVRVLSQGFTASESDNESCIIRCDESLPDSLGSCDIPSSAEEALRRWTNVFN